MDTAYVPRHSAEYRQRSIPRWVSNCEVLAGPGSEGGGGQSFKFGAKTDRAVVLPDAHHGRRRGRRSRRDPSFP